MSQIDTDGLGGGANGDGRDPQTFAIIGAAMEVHAELGIGFLEPEYQEALAIEFIERQIPFRREVDVPILYEGEQLSRDYRADFIVFDDNVVELKALRALGTIEQSQLLNYLGHERQARPPAELRYIEIGVQAPRAITTTSVKSVSICGSSKRSKS